MGVTCTLFPFFVYCTPSKIYTSVVQGILSLYIVYAMYLFKEFFMFFTAMNILGNFCIKLGFFFLQKNTSSLSLSVTLISHWSLNLSCTPCLNIFSLTPFLFTFLYTLYVPFYVMPSIYTSHVLLLFTQQCCIKDKLYLGLLWYFDVLLCTEDNQKEEEFFLEWIFCVPAHFWKSLGNG